MNLNAKQIIAIIIAVLSVLGGASANLTDLFGAGIAKIVVSASTLFTATLSSVLAVISSQTNDIANVRAIATNPSSQPSVSLQAKAALLDATASLPEVENDIHVTSKALANATVSDQIKAP